MDKGRGWGVVLLNLPSEQVVTKGHSVSSRLLKSGIQDPGGTVVPELTVTTVLTAVAPSSPGKKKLSEYCRLKDDVQLMKTTFETQCQLCTCIIYTS